MRCYCHLRNSILHVGGLLTHYLCWLFDWLILRYLYIKRHHGITDEVTQNITVIDISRCEIRDGNNWDWRKSWRQLQERWNSDWNGRSLDGTGADNAGGRQCSEEFIANDQNHEIVRPLLHSWVARSRRLYEPTKLAKSQKVSDMEPSTNLRNHHTCGDLDQRRSILCNIRRCRYHWAGRAVDEIRANFERFAHCRPTGRVLRGQSHGKSGSCISSSVFIHRWRLSKVQSHGEGGNGYLLVSDSNRYVLLYLPVIHQRATEWRLRVDFDWHFPRVETLRYYHHGRLRRSGATISSFIGVSSSNEEHFSAMSTTSFFHNPKSLPISSNASKFTSLSLCFMTLFRSLFQLKIHYLTFSREFPQAMNYIVMSLLCDQFHKLNEEFSKCIGGRGEFHGHFEQFRRRHQAISRSVKEADRFLMISNVACFCSHMFCVIVTLFCSIFYRQYTASHSAEDAFIYTLYLVINLFSLSLAAGLAVIVNSKVSTYNYNDVSL